MADPNTPTWLTPDNPDTSPGASAGNNAAASPGGGGGLDPAPASGTAAASSSAGGQDGSVDPDSEDLPGIILVMRLANMGAALALMTVSIWLMVTIPTISAFVLAVYATCGGLLICCLETQLKFLRVLLAVNYGFLFNSVWRFIFYILLASIAWSYEELLGRIVAIGLIFVACFNTYVLCRYPSYRKVREKIAEEEDKRIEARISKEVKRQAANQINK